METENKFKNIIKYSFHDILKPLGFKKKNLNFYLNKQFCGQIINIQKSIYYSKDCIVFTINIGIFIPEFWVTYFHKTKEMIPDFPTEPDCLIRNRIGNLKNVNDMWYKCSKKTNKDKLINKLKDDINKYILPYLNSINKKEDILDLINKNDINHPIGKLIYYGENNLKELAREQYNKLINDKEINKAFLKSVLKYGTKYNLN